MWIVILGLGLVALVGIWACCYVASEADKAMENEDNNVNRV